MIKLNNTYIYFIIFRHNNKFYKNLFENYNDAIYLLELIIKMQDELVKFGRYIKYD